MLRRSFRGVGSPFALLMPLALACASDAVPTGSTVSTSAPGTGSESTSGDPDTTSGSSSTTTTVTTADPDSSTTDAQESSTTDESSTGLVG